MQSKQNQILYLDYNATTPVLPEVLEAMMPWFTEKFGNAASSTHIYGWEASEAVTIAREQLAAFIGAGKEEMIFTSGATESINLAIKGASESYASKGNHIITCATEHKAVLDTCAALEKKGYNITYLPVHTDGTIDIKLLEDSITSSTILLAIMYANNETGYIHPVQQIGAIAKEKNILFFCDATQAVGKIPVNVLNDNIDLMAFSSHKIYGPKGVGALYVRRKNPRVTIKAQTDGGGHERGLRSGTLNVPGIVGFGKACSLATHDLQDRMNRFTLLRNKLEDGVLSIGNICVNGNTLHRLPNTSNLQFNQMPSTGLLSALTKKMAVSAGSACTSASPHPSHVLKAMGISETDSKNSIRFSLGIPTTDGEIDYAITQIKEAVHTLRNERL